MAVTAEPLSAGEQLARRLGVALVDADNHYCETTDAFARHLPAAWRKQNPFRRVIDEKGRQRFMVNGRLYRRIVDPTFDSVAKPGYLVRMFENEGVSDYARTGEDLEPIRAEYRDRDARLAAMDAFRVEKIGCSRPWA